MQGRGKSLKSGLVKTRRSFFDRITGLLRESEITEEAWEHLEELLIQADIGVKTSLDLIEYLRAAVDVAGARTTGHAEELLKSRLVEILDQAQHPYLEGQRDLNVVLIVGVNGSGKTTSIAKLARYHQEQGDQVMLAAADTFRAAASDQLKIWGDRLGVDVIAHQPDADPGAVLFDAIRASQARGVDVLIIDTAGRLHTKYNLMRELSKLSGIAQKQVHQAPHETLLVVDAMTGQNALSQAVKFAESCNLTGVILAKLDSTSKGGMAFALANELHLPVLFAATGEQVNDFCAFDAKDFVKGLFGA